MARDDVFAKRTQTVIQVAGAQRLRWELSELTTSDGHTARGAFMATVRALPEENELRMLEEALLGTKSAVTSGDVIDYFATAILAAARKFSTGWEAKALLAEDGRRKLLDAVLESAGGVGFGCGIEVIQPAQVDLDCPTLNRQQIEQMQRQAAERRAADQMDYLKRSAELFGQFESIRAATPRLSPGQVLARVSDADQADVFRAVVLASAQKRSQAKLWAVAGNYLICIDGEESAQPEMIDVPPNLGPVRSVRGDGEGNLLLGCRSGILRVNPEAVGDAGQFADPQTTSQLGFNSALVSGDKLWAAHGEAGLVCWRLDEPKNPQVAIRPAGSNIAGFSPRNLVRLDSQRLLLSSGKQLVLVSSEGGLQPIPHSGDSEIVGICPQEQRILTAHADGQICSWSPETWEITCKQRRSGNVLAAAALPWLGDVRLLLATETGGILCVGPDDEVLTQYSSPYQGLRIVAAVADKIAAVTSDRQRIMIWHSWDGKKPFLDLYLYGMAKHRIADISFAE
jgi:hypothetical protein